MLYCIRFKDGSECLRVYLLRYVGRYGSPLRFAISGLPPAVSGTRTLSLDVRAQRDPRPIPVTELVGTSDPLPDLG